MNIYTLKKLIKSGQGEINKDNLFTSDNDSYLSDGIILFKRSFFYVPKLEKALVTGTRKQELHKDVITRFSEASEVVEIQDELIVRENLLVAIVGESTLYRKVNANKLATFACFLLPEYKDCEITTKISKDDTGFISIFVNDVFAGCLATQIFES